MSILSAKMLGKPYRWAQDLCGLEFLNTSSASTSTDRSYSGISNELVQLSVPKIVKQIRSRWQARLGLHSQITALGKKLKFQSNNKQNPIPIRPPISLIL